MPRYNLNQDDIDIIVSSLSKSADKEWDPKDQARIKRLISRLQGKINAIVENVNTQPIDPQEKLASEHPIVYDDPVWNHYQRKSS